MKSKASSKEQVLWHYQPEIPIGISPLFDWPPKPLAAFKWLAAYWFAISAVVINVLIAVSVYYFFFPDSSVMKTLSVTWIGQIWLCNILLALTIAGSLHWYFYVLRKQDRDLKFEGRDLNRSNKLYTFNNQVWDNIFWTLASGITILTTYECLYFWVVSNGWIPQLAFAQNPIWFLAMFAIIPLWSSLHFYWIHKFLHWPPLFKVAHALHHRNVNVGPWSGISMHPIEHLLYFSSILIHFFIASHPIHFLFHIFYLGLQPMASHCGFDGLQIDGKKRIQLGDFFHQLHHKHYKCNYGTSEMPWDRWFGSYHDGSDEATVRIRRRKF